MANTQTTVPLFVANTVLTAAQQNISAGTGVPVFATTVTRDAAFGGSNKALAEGQLAYIEASNIVQYYDGAAWATVGPSTAGALTLISATTIGTTVSSVTVSSAFSATYDAYKIIISGGTGSDQELLALKLGSTTTGYYAGYTGITYSSGAAILGADNNAAAFTQAARISTNGINLNIELMSPFLAGKTFFSGSISGTSNTKISSGFLDNSTSYTAFTLTPTLGTITGGTIRVYGYSNS